MTLRVQSFSNPATLPALAEAWDRLDDERSPGAVFRSSAWLLPWWRHLGHGALAILIVRDGDRTAGVLPAYRVATPLGERLRLLGDGPVGSDYLGSIAPAGDRAAVARALASWLVEREGDAWLERLEADDPLCAALEERGRGRAGALVERRRGMPSPMIRLEGQYGPWLDSLPDGAGAQLRRRRRWLERRPGFRIERREGPDEVLAGFDALFSLHDARWALAGGSDGIRGARQRDFHRDAARALAERGWARLWLLHVEGAPRAALYGFERGGRFAFYQSGHDPAWRPRSVGTVLLHAAIEDAFSRGLGEFDLLHGDEPYKLAITPRQRWLVGLRVAAGPRARLLRAAERASEAARWIARAALPEAAVEWARMRRLEAAS